MRTFCLFLLLGSFAFAKPVSAESTAPAIEMKGFPQGKLFLPLIADPKQPAFRVNVQWLKSDVRTTLGSVVSFGETIGLVRWKRQGEANALQLDIAGGVVALFDLLSGSIDLINADYIVGFPISYRHGPLTTRLRYYHQSSHLGDEFLLSAPVTRFNVSFEAIEALMALQVASLRLYGGGDWIVRRDPSTLDRLGFHTGVEWRSQKPLFSFQSDWIVTPVAALDLKFWQVDDFRPAVNVAGGFQFGAEDDPEEIGRLWRAMLEVYYGTAPYGQFFITGDRFFSVGLAAHFHF